jgi:vancomycin resistance protein YoaR
MRPAQFFTIRLFVFLLIFIGLTPLFCRAENTSAPDQSIELKVGGSSYELPNLEIEKWIKIKTDLVYNPKYDTEIEESDFCRYKKSIICELIFSSKKESHIQKTSEVSVDRDLAGKFLDDLSQKVNRNPQNAKFSVENGKVAVFSISEKGITLDKDKSLEVLVSFLKKNSLSPKNTLEIPFKETAPEISMDSIDNMGITTLIGEGKSNFAGSPKNRIHNIQTAIARYNGLLIKPNEEFSFVGALGEVDGDHGYLPELVIKQNKTELDFGGGICQVSTTAFRAAIYSGLKITARTNHAYPVGYYNPQGMDATVYVPKPDLKFINNTPGYILIQTHIEGTILFFDFYGTDDGRKTNVIGPTITERNPDGSMKAQFTQQVLDKNGNTLREDVIKSVYKSPSLYPHPGELITEKPADWSQKQWDQYKKENHI